MVVYTTLLRGRTQPRFECQTSPPVSDDGAPQRPWKRRIVFGQKKGARAFENGGGDMVQERITTRTTD